MLDETKVQVIGWGGFLTSFLGASLDESIMFILGLVFLLLGIYNRIQDGIIKRRTIDRIKREERDLLDGQASESNG